MTQLPSLAILGGGNMGTAIIAGLRRLPAMPAVTVCDPVAAVRDKHAAAGLAVTDNPQQAVAGAGLVLLAVKPQQAGELLPQLRLRDDALLVSILAGTTTTRIAALLGRPQPLVRAMPNTPMAIGRGMVGIAAGAHARPGDLDLAEALFAPAARVLRVAEERLDAITAVSGSGPAYVFLVAECLQAAAMELGFSSDEAALLAGTTLSGSVDYLLSEPGFPAARLRQQVTSPGGTTAAALAVFEEAGVRATFVRALQAAERRARELAAS
jgi:pyrroline-5-carboxylate reductase